MHIPPRVVKVADVLAWLLVLVWAGYASLGTNVFGKTPWPGAVVDYHLLYDLSSYVAQRGEYPDYPYPYPPPSVLLQYATAQFPFEISAVLYIAATTTIAVLVWKLLAALVQERRLGAGLGALLCMTTCGSAFAWDLRAQNCNLVFLLFVVLGLRGLVGERPGAAGFWIAASFALKLFSVLLLPYLWWRRQYRALAYAALFSAAFWIVLPLAYFGPTGTAKVYRGWYAMTTRLAEARPRKHCTIISLHNSAHWLTAGDAERSRLVVGAFQAAWGAMLLGGAWLSRRRVDPSGDGFGTAADVALLLLAPISVSPYLEPYHFVPLSITAVLLLQASTDSRQTPRLRAAAALLFLAMGLLCWFSSPWEVRGMLANLRALIGVGGVVVVAAVRKPFTRTAVQPVPATLKSAGRDAPRWALHTS